MGLEDVCGAVSPFEGRQGMVAGWYVGLVVGAPCVNFRMACMIVVKRRLRMARGRCSMHRTNSCATCWVCSVGDSVGSWQCTGYNSKVPEIRIARDSGT